MSIYKITIDSSYNRTEAISVTLKGELKKLLYTGERDAIQAILTSNNKKWKDIKYIKYQMGRLRPFIEDPMVDTERSGFLDADEYIVIFRID